MVAHIVFWKLKESALGKSKEENTLLLKEKLDAMKALIPQIKELQTGVDFNGSQAAYDFALYTTFASKEDLEQYQVDPAHVAVKDFVVAVTDDRAVVDYEY